MTKYEEDIDPNEITWNSDYETEEQQVAITLLEHPHA